MMHEPPRLCLSSDPVRGLHGRSAQLPVQSRAHSLARKRAGTYGSQRLAWPRVTLWSHGSPSPSLIASAFGPQHAQPAAFRGGRWFEGDPDTFAIWDTTTNQPMTSPLESLYYYHHISMNCSAGTRSRSRPRPTLYLPAQVDQVTCNRRIVAGGNTTPDRQS